MQRHAPLSSFFRDNALVQTGHSALNAGSMLLFNSARNRCECPTRMALLVGLSSASIQNLVTMCGRGTVLSRDNPTN
jgi:hypothetical protein